VQYSLDVPSEFHLFAPSDSVDNNEPINVVIVTSEAAYYGDTLFIPEDRDDEEQYSDAFRKAFNDWWDRYFTAHEAPDTTEVQCHCLCNRQYYL
jgi:hypothetical protein